MESCGKNLKVLIIVLPVSCWSKSVRKWRPFENSPKALNWGLHGFKKTLKSRAFSNKLEFGATTGVTKIYQSKVSSKIYKLRAIRRSISLFDLRPKILRFEKILQRFFFRNKQNQTASTTHWLLKYLIVFPTMFSPFSFSFETINYNVTFATDIDPRHTQNAASFMCNKTEIASARNRSLEWDYIEMCE